MLASVLCRIVTLVRIATAQCCFGCRGGTAVNLKYVLSEEITENTSGGLTSGVVGVVLLHQVGRRNR